MLGVVSEMLSSASAEVYAADCFLTVIAGYDDEQPELSLDNAKVLTDALFPDDGLVTVVHEGAVIRTGSEIAHLTVRGEQWTSEPPLDDAEWDAAVDTDVEFLNDAADVCVVNSVTEVVIRRVVDRAGRYRMRVSARGRDLALDDPERHRGNFTLGDFGRPVGEVRVQLWRSDGPVPHRIRKMDRTGTVIAQMTNPAQFR